jgi:hypothetical protein
MSILAMSKRRNCSFNDQKEFKFIKLDKLCSDGTKVVCQHCNVHFSAAHRGRSDINDHLHSQKHKDAEKILASVKNISSFMVIVKAIKLQQMKLLLLIILCVTGKVFAQMTAC